MGEYTTDSTVQTRRRDWRVYWRLLRPHTLTAAFIPVLIGTTLALLFGHFHLLLFLTMLFASLLIQAATNMFNEYFDFKRGLDNEQSVGIGGAIVRDGLAPETVLRLAYVLLGCATLAGVYICLQSSWWVAVVGTICMACGYYYTGGPYPIAYTPFGELVSGFFMGVVIILISFYIQTGFINGESVLISIPTALLIGGILMANNIRDLEGDKKKGRQTLAILLGRKKAIIVLGGMFAAAYLWMLGLILLSVVSPWLGLVFFSIPKAIQATKAFRGKVLARQLMPAMKATAQMNTLFGVLVSAGLFAEYWF